MARLLQMEWKLRTSEPCLLALLSPGLRHPRPESSITPVLRRQCTHTHTPVKPRLGSVMHCWTQAPQTRIFYHPCLEKRIYTHTHSCQAKIRESDALLEGPETMGGLTIAQKTFRCVLHVPFNSTLQRINFRGDSETPMNFEWETVQKALLSVPLCTHPLTRPCNTLTLLRFHAGSLGHVLSSLHLESHREKGKIKASLT